MVKNKFIHGEQQLIIMTTNDVLVLIMFNIYSNCCGMHEDFVTKLK